MAKRLWRATLSSAAGVEGEGGTGIVERTPSVRWGLASVLISRVKGVLASRGRLLAVLADLPAMLGAAFVGRAKSHRVVAGPASEKAEDLMTLTELASQGKLRPSSASNQPRHDPPIVA